MPTASLAAAAIDGRAQNPRFIQRQLRRLYEALTEHAQGLQKAAVADGSATSSEASLELSLALAAVRRRFMQISVPAILLDEYHPAQGRDAKDRRVPVGVVYIRSQRHTPLYSIIAPLSSAIAAGNCALVEMPQSLLETPRILKDVLISSLDQDTFAVADTIPNDGATAPNCLLVDQTQDHEPRLAAHVLRVDSQDARVVAIVDRSADVSAAARALVQARAAFDGRSPYAPDVVLINEFVMGDFIRAAINACTEHLSGSHEISQHDSLKAKIRRNPRISTLEAEERRDPDTTVVLEGDNGMIVKIGNRNLPILSRKVSSNVLVVQATSSLDDAIDCANSPGGTLLASYHFGALPVTKYTSQFVISTASFINHIPIQLHVGPASPGQWPASAIDRYRPEMFSTPSPIFTQLPTDNKSEWKASMHAVPEPLPRDDQREGKTIGFFDQGLITGATLLMTPVFGTLAIGSFYAIKFGLRQWRG